MDKILTGVVSLGTASVIYQKTIDGKNYSIAEKKMIGVAAAVLGLSIYGGISLTSRGISYTTGINDYYTRKIILVVFTYYMLRNI